MVIGSMETSISISKLAMVTPGRILVCLRTVLETLLFDIGRFLVLIRFRATGLKLVFGRTEVDFFLDFFHLIAKSPNDQTETKVELVIPIPTLRGTKERGEAG